ncbi:hypothetical protein GQ600_22266 [Phytophthora cactorum]|nr:hypothetical protein GQ600_22266 [Phytophthora cactorum]
MDISSVAEEMEIAGRVPSDYGSHSARKGYSTYVSGCCTGGPSSASVCLRAGWNLPGVQDTYVRYEAAGDRVVGRLLPAYRTRHGFRNIDTVDDNVRNGINICYPNAPERLKYIRTFMLASLYIIGGLEANVKPGSLAF